MFGSITVPSLRGGPGYRGHANVSIASAYLHVAVDDEGVGNLFGVA